MIERQRNALTEADCEVAVDYLTGNSTPPTHQIEHLTLAKPKHMAELSGDRLA